MSSSEPLIEIAGDHDYPFIAAIYNEYILLGTANMEETTKTAADIMGWTAKFNNREQLWVMRENQTVIGWGIIKRYSDREGYRFACETAVYITEKKLGRGLGTLMKKHLIKTCKNLGYRHLVAKIFATNQNSINYNQRLGYTIVGTQKAIGYKNDQWIDMVIMQLLIPES